MTDERDSSARAASVGRAATWPGFAVTLAALLALFAGGSWLYTHVVGRLFLQAQSAPIVPAGLIIALAVLAGAASFFSPCSLAITPAFLAYFIESHSREGRPPDTRRQFCAAALIAAGIVGVSAVAGLLVTVIGAVVYNVLIYLIPLVGAIFVALGIIMIFGRGEGFARMARFLPGRRYYEHYMSSGRGSSAGGLIAFGAAYGAASHSCTLPVVIGLLMLPIAAGNYWLAGIAILIYGFALAGLMLLMLTLGQPTLTAMRRWTGGYLSYVIGVLFLATGGYLFHYFMTLLSQRYANKISCLPLSGGFGPGTVSVRS